MTDKQCPFKVGDELAVCHNGFGGRRNIHYTTKVSRILKTYFETDNGTKWDFGSTRGGEHHCNKRGDLYGSTYATPYADAIKAEQAARKLSDRARAIAHRIGERANHLTDAQIEALLALADTFPERS